MEDPWFGRKANGYTAGPVTWQGCAVTFIAFGGGIACHSLLARPWNDWAAGACVLVFIIAYWLTFDPNTEST
jgi:hypothetical protein